MQVAHTTTGKSGAPIGNDPEASARPLLIDEGASPSPITCRGLAPAETRVLTAAVKRGDESAFTRFHELYCLRLYKLLLRLAKGREADAREVLQVVMIKVTKRFKVFDEEVKLWAWLCLVARHSYVDLYRSRRRDQRFVSLETLAEGLSESTEGETAVGVAFGHAMSELPEEDRELLRVVYLDKRPLVELAGESGVSYKAMESRLTRLRQKVRVKLLAHLQNENAPCPKR
ncbi:MAG: sigma-70 family RNA polymerase sigma factor [Verrucomicrobiota bacterium]